MRLPRSLSGEELVAALGRLGCEPRPHASGVGMSG